MGKCLLQIPIFATAIHECHEILKSKDVDLMDIITTDDPTIFDNILNAFVGISAIQVRIISLPSLELYRYLHGNFRFR